MIPLIIVSIASFAYWINLKDIPGLTNAANELAFQVSGLRAPENIDYTLSRYSDEKDRIYKETLKSAWQNALKAKEAAADIKRIAAGARLDIKNNQPVLNIDVSISTREQEVNSYLSGALTDSYLSLQNLLNLLDSDKRELDLFGADNANFSKSQIYLELRRFIDSVNSEIDGYNRATVIEANPCSLTGILYKTICIIRQMSINQKPDTTQAVSIFNDIIGYPGPSLLEDYFSYHLNLTALMLEMRNTHEDAERAFDDRTSETEEKIAALKDEKVFLINSDAMNKITGRLKSSITLAEGRGESLSGKFIFFVEGLAEINHKKQLVDRILEQKQDDYLFLATDELKELNSELVRSSHSLDSLAKNMKDLVEEAKKLYNKLLLENDGSKTTALYLTALDTGKKAESRNALGDSLLDYIRAIGYLSEVHRSTADILNLDSDFKHLHDVLNSLSAFGIDVSYEAEQYNRLVQIGDPALRDDVYLSVQGLDSKLRAKADFGLEKLYSSRERLARYFADYHVFLQEPSVSQKLDRAKIDGMEKDFDGSLTFDELSNLNILYSKYYDMEKYLETTFNSLANDYLRDFISVKYDFLEPVCGNLSKARVLISVRNPTSVKFSGVTVTKKLNLIGNLENPLVFKINTISPGEIFFKEYTANLFYNCSDNTTVLANRTLLEKRFIEANNRIVQLCIFTECSELKRAYKTAYNALEIDDIEALVYSETQDFLKNYTGKETKKKLETVNLLLASFEKAVATDVNFEFNASLAYSKNDYLLASSNYKKLQKMYDALSPISFSSKEPADQFNELVTRFSPSDVADFFDSLDSLDRYLNTSLGAVQNEAKTALLSAKQGFMESRRGQDSLKKATDAYNGGSYNKAILFAGQVPREKQAQGFDFTILLYGGIAAVLIAFCLFFIRKPKEEKKVMRRLLRAT